MIQADQNFRDSHFFGAQFKIVENAVDSNVNWKRVFDSFKIPWLYSKQEKCIEALLKGKDVCASLPTG